MHSRVGVHRAGELTDRQSERRFLEGGLHLSASEDAEIAALLGAAAVRELRREFSQRRASRDDLLAVFWAKW